MKALVHHPLLPLSLYSAFLSFLLTAHMIAEVRVSDGLERFASLVWLFLILIWIETDARRRRSTPCFDFGFLCWLTFPLSVVWYCFWSRGWRGFGLLSVQLGLWVAPYVVAGIVWRIFSSPR